MAEWVLAESSELRAVMNDDGDVEIRYRSNFVPQPVIITMDYTEWEQFTEDAIKRRTF